MAHADASSSTTTGRTWLITGATGFIGGHLVRALQRRGDHVVALTRDRARAERRLGPQVQAVESLTRLPHDSTIDGVVNLAGARILGMPWTARRRRLLLDSRIRTTQAVVKLCARLQRKPGVLVSGSAVGYYGVHGDELLDESAPSQPIFQSRLCSEWENAAAAAAASGIRVVCLRTGVVLSGDGGALPRLATPTRLFIGAIPGSGEQWLSWIHIDDMTGLVLTALDDDRCKGAINATAPQPLRYREFYRLLGGVLHRPVWMHIPAALMRLSLGEMSQLLVEGQRVVPRRALQLGFQFRYPAAADALEAVYG
jgi:uncharacterized protein (TIGR01777 family)